MPATLMDWATLLGIPLMAIAVYFAWRQLRGTKPKTVNTVVNGNHNTQEGGPGATENKVTSGDHNRQKG